LSTRDILSCRGEKNHRDRPDHRNNSSLAHRLNSCGLSNGGQSSLSARVPVSTLARADGDNTLREARWAARPLTSARPWPTAQGVACGKEAVRGPLVSSLPKIAQRIFAESPISHNLAS
jgi:hypothetical protein